MAKVEITPGIISPSEEEIESLTGKGAEKGLVPLSRETKTAIAAVLGVAGAAGAGAPSQAEIEKRKLTNSSFSPRMKRE